ncbi:CPBP family intramembrane glutamic endopeptidase [Enterococcus sp. DIV0756]|uniref:CPBP family intramembrane glutamic endopeptidase n=1 Tax=Enterococcus sp. DIV0756 TaxID=2774636 RepID=UPI003F2632E6
MNNRKIIRRYLGISFGLAFPMGLLFLFLHNNDVSTNTTVIGIVGLIVGGGSTAIAGVTIAKSSGRVSKYREILRDFFNIRQSVGAYLLVILFLLLNFGTAFRPISLKQFIELFLMSLIFGGLEEIGWRYIFQPTLEKNRSFITATFLTAFVWGIWHFIYFIIDGSIFDMSTMGLLTFYMGLLGNSFVLACIFFLTKSLWLCVCYHACLNAFTQLLGGNDLMRSVFFTGVNILISCLLVHILGKARFSKSTGS